MCFYFVIHAFPSLPLCFSTEVYGKFQRIRTKKNLIGSLQNNFTFKNCFTIDLIDRIKSKIQANYSFFILLIALFRQKR